MKNFKNWGLGLGLGLMAAASSSYAALDVTAVTAKLAEGETAVAAIGGAVLLVWATRKVYSLIAR